MQTWLERKRISMTLFRQLVNEQNGIEDPTSILQSNASVDSISPEFVQASKDPGGLHFTCMRNSPQFCIRMSKVALVLEKNRPRSCYELLKSDTKRTGVLALLIRYQK